ncbi:chloramphenicol phosphotransferase CPT family protein [Paenibacillus polysaccharolyticus]|uniref:chloramphenicol phosphotransferase CPT family protein n=1 Tax=Paenibacillus polysaccharolyticus TaxID=582692 RepID=UPI00209D53FC|nr:chloramphenicol phosphotransferase CPT family protein [Paenibacillus polysaccharolyticus]MCP1135267.1 chloramphenicol phosphotransferase CPT family protein [Paenibacillus polysaccharolyticus]
MERGLIIFLNGTSSSGKTSIALEMKKQGEMPLHHLSVDQFFQNYDHFIDTTYPDMQPTREVEPGVMSDILFGPIGALYYSTIKLFSELGLNVIVDTVISDDKFFNDFYELLTDYPILFVGVHCSKEELTRREQSRGDREIGLAHSQFDYIYAYDEYDLEVNTEELSSASCAEKILSYMNSGQEYSAFKKLSRR